MISKMMVGLFIGPDPKEIVLPFVGSFNYAFEKIKLVIPVESLVYDYGIVYLDSVTGKKYLLTSEGRAELQYL